MELRLSSSQSSFREEVRAFIKTNLPNEIRERLRRGHPPRKSDVVTWQKILHQKGWAAPNWPIEFGGAGLGIEERLILLQEIYHAPAPLPLVLNINMLGPVLLRFGTQEQKQEFLPKLASFDLWFCQGFSEPGAGSDLASLRTSAKLDGDHYVVNGQKIWTSGAQHADWTFALVRTDSSTKMQQGISMILINLRSPGIKIRPIISIDGAHHLNEVFFEDVIVPAKNIVGEEGRGWDCAKYLLSCERAAIANVGLCEERLSYLHELSEEIFQAGRSIKDDMNLRLTIARLGAEIRALDLTNWRFLLNPDIDKENPGYASILKLKGTELLQEITALLARVSGLSGLERRSTEGQDELHPLAALVPRYLYYRAATIYGGTSEVQKNILAKTILG